MTMVPVLEPNPKWTLLEDVLQEIRAQQELMEGHAGAAASTDAEEAKMVLAAAKAPVLVAARDSAAVNQLRGASSRPQSRMRRFAAPRTGENLRHMPLAEMLDVGQHTMLNNTWQHYLQQRAERSRSRTAVRGAGSQRRDRADSEPSRSGKKKSRAAGDAEPAAATAAAGEHEQQSTGIAFLALDEREGAGLRATKPSFIVMMDPDQSFIRDIELFKADNPGWPCRVYFLVYKDSVEEQRYLASVKRERKAFESLINTRAQSVPPKEQDGRLLARGSTPGACTRQRSYRR